MPEPFFRTDRSNRSIQSQKRSFNPDFSPFDAYYFEPLYSHANECGLYLQPA